MAFDNFMDLSVEIPKKAIRFTGNINITDCFEKFMDVERMINCGYKCEGCKREVNIEKDLTIFRFPRILVIHLKRFYHSAMRREKLNTTVAFPQKALDMRKYAPHSSKSTFSALTLSRSLLTCVSVCFYVVRSRNQTESCV